MSGQLDYGRPENELLYNKRVEAFREEEYPMLKDAIYLDHAGTALYSKSLMEAYMADMMSNLYGNPHSASVSSQSTTNRIEDTRLKVLRFFNADPEEFDVVYVANATAGIKLVMDAFKSLEDGFNYGYHVAAHTSLVGVRESAVSSRCLTTDDVELWVSGSGALVEDGGARNSLFAYPAQSNLDGTRFPLSWASRASMPRRSEEAGTYTLLDASALVATAQLDLSDATVAPDFTVLSFYKIFGFPDMGALIVKKETGSILRTRKYFGGGTVDMVLCVKEQWHASKCQSLHVSLEDGTLPFHNILALDFAISAHKKLFDSMDQIAFHTSYLAQKLYQGLAGLRHGNGEPVCELYSMPPDLSRHNQGPVVAFNVRNSSGAWVSNVEFEKLASVRNFHLRTGGHCNPGGVATHLNLEAWEIKRNFSAGFRCGNETDIYAGKITGIIRASLGAMSIASDVEAFIAFVREFYVEREAIDPVRDLGAETSGDLIVESLTVYPIKSCGGFNVPPSTPWEIRPEGLVWDREWCLVHQGTGQALSQKRHPRMALIRPTLDFKSGMLRVRYLGQAPKDVSSQIQIPLSANPSLFKTRDAAKSASRVCGDAIMANTYADKEINDFFSSVLEVSCVLTRFPAGGSGMSTRHAKAHMQRHQRPLKQDLQSDSLSRIEPLTPPDSDTESQRRPILLSNESPILSINRSSLDALNEEIVRTGGKPADASVFRANIVLGQTSTSQGSEPYSEDHWSYLRIGRQEFQMLGSCRRCHMICVNQETAGKDREPFVTLAKTRRFDSKIFFGSHMCHIPSDVVTRESRCPTIQVGDAVTVPICDR